jgi:predicted metal-dependent enzyme (double-stranded beta helix superfamily)
MAYTLREFCDDTHRILKTNSLAEALAKVSERLSDLLRNPDFVAQTFNEDLPPGKRELYHDPELDFYVLAHVQEPGKAGKPHSHGASWAIYGNAREVTEMTEWRRTNPQSDEHYALAPDKRYGLRAGETRAYGPGVIHSTSHPRKAWVIRVTGTDLDKISRYHFRKQDKILESA